MELQGRSRFVNVHLEFMKVVRSSVELTLICEYTHNQEEAHVSVIIMMCILYNIIYIYMHTIYISDAVCVYMCIHA